MNTIILNSTELMIASLAGSMRRVSSIKDGLNKNKHAEKSDWSTDVDGAAAEMAFAKFLNVYWSAANNSFKEPDVGTWQVRSTSRKDGHLIIRHNDKELEERFVLIITEPPKYHIVGFILNLNSRQDRYWRGDSWWVPQTDLTSL